jgi:hypothetical protein
VVATLLVVPTFATFAQESTLTIEPTRELSNPYIGSDFRRDSEGSNQKQNREIVQCGLSNRSDDESTSVGRGFGDTEQEALAKAIKDADQDGREFQEQWASNRKCPDNCTRYVAMPPVQIVDPEAWATSFYAWWTDQDYEAAAPYQANVSVLCLP